MTREGLAETVFRGAKEKQIENKRIDIIEYHIFIYFGTGNYITENDEFFEFLSFYFFFIFYFCKKK